MRAFRRDDLSWAHPRITRGRKLLTMAAVLAALGPFQGTVMATMVIWSAMTWRVLMNGEPAEGAVLKRDFNWGRKDENGSDRTTAAVAGEFSLRSIERISILGRILPHGPVIRQVMTVIDKAAEYNAWAMYKRDYDADSENGGRPVDVTSRLEAERDRHGAVMGLCEFN